MEIRSIVTLIVTVSFQVWVRVQVASAGVAHSNIMAEIEVVFSSSYLRATQTADLFLGQLSEKNLLKLIGLMI